MEELLYKAQVYSLSLREIGERLKQPLKDETLPEWKVEMAVDAAEAFLEELLDAVDSTLRIKDWGRVNMGNILRARDLRPLIPAALGIVLRRGDLINELKGLRQVAEEWKRREAERDNKVKEFLSAFRGLANSVVEKGVNTVSLNEVKTRVDEHLSEVFPSEVLREHIAVALSDILRFIAAKREEVDRAITEGLNKLRSFYMNTLFDYPAMRKIGFQSDEQIQLAHDYLAPAAMLQHYVNRLAAGKAHNVLPQITPSLDLIPEGLDSYLPVLIWSTFYPSEREQKPLESLALDSPYRFLATRGIVTNIGRDLLSVNSGSGYRLVDEVGKLMGLELKLPRWLSEANKRRVPDVMRGYLKNLRAILEFLRDNWVEIKDRIDSVKTPALASFIENLGLVGDLDAVRTIIGNKLEALAEFERTYPDNAVLMESLPDYILGLSDIVDWALGSTSQEILSNINRILSEIAVYFIPEANKRLQFMRPFADQAFFGPAGDYLPLRFGFIRYRLPEEKGRRAHEKGDIVGEALTEITNYIINGPSEGEDYRTWFERVKGAIQLILFGNSAQGEGANYWREKYSVKDPETGELQSLIDWDTLAADRPSIGLFLKVPSKGWLKMLQEVEAEIERNPGQEEETLRRAHEKLRGVVRSAWHYLADQVSSSIFGWLEKLQAQDLGYMARYLRSAREAAKRLSEVSLEQPIGEEGRAPVETIAESARVGLEEEAEERAERIVDIFVALLTEIFKKGEAQTLDEVLSNDRVRLFFSIVRKELEDDSLLGEKIKAILQEIRAGARKVSLPKAISVDEFLSLMGGELLPTEVEEKIEEVEGEEAIEEEEAGEEVIWEEEGEEREVAEGEGEEEAENEERTLMKFYLLSKVLPAYSS
jgi:hypothetical protein